MTDNEIIKALECCTTNGASCKDCPAFVKVDRSNCKKYFRGALDLINRQKAEIEDWKQKNKALRFSLDLCKGWEERAKAEAYKEFAEKMNKEAEKVEIDREGDFVETDNKIYDTVANWCKATSDNILKEKVGDKDV